MKRFLASALIVGVSTFGFVGCAEETKTEDVKKVKTPGGTDETTTTVKETKTGDAKDPK